MADRSGAAEATAAWMQQQLAYWQARIDESEIFAYEEDEIDSAKKSVASQKTVPQLLNPPVGEPSGELVDAPITIDTLCTPRSFERVCRSLAEPDDNGIAKMVRAHQKNAVKLSERYGEPLAVAAGLRSRSNSRSNSRQVSARAHVPAGVTPDGGTPAGELQTPIRLQPGDGGALQLPLPKPTTAVVPAASSGTASVTGPVAAPAAAAGEARAAVPVAALVSAPAINPGKARSSSFGSSSGRARGRASAAGTGVRGDGAGSEQGGGRHDGTGRRPVGLPSDYAAGASRSSPTRSQGSTAAAELRAEFRAVRAPQQSTGGDESTTERVISLPSSSSRRLTATYGVPGQVRVPALGRKPKTTTRTPTHTELVNEYRRLAAYGAAVRCDHWTTR